MRNFEYFEPTTIDEGISLLKHFGDKAKILAGGTNIVPELKAGRVKVECIINIKNIDTLKEVFEDDGGIHIGALVTLSELAWPDISRRQIIQASLLKRVPDFFRKIISLMGNPQVRNIATVAGNLAWASPASDTAPPLLALDARLKIQGMEGERTLSLGEFFIGPNKTALKQNEIITTISIPAESLTKAGAAHKFMKRKANTLAVCSGAVTVNKSSPGIVKDVRIAVGAVAPIPTRIRKAELLIEGQGVNEKILKKIKEIISEEISPITDSRSTAWFRKEVTPALVEQCITELIS